MPVTKPGDPILLGEHRLLCGDSTVATDVERLMGGALADCMWTDPPYGVDYVGKTADALTIQNDSRGEVEALVGSGPSRWRSRCSSPAQLRTALTRPVLIGAGRGEGGLAQRLGSACSGHSFPRDVDRLIITRWRPFWSRPSRCMIWS